MSESEQRRGGQGVEYQDVGADYLEQRQLQKGAAGWVLLAGLLWIGAFGIFVWLYAPILLRPRIDGRPD